MTLDELANKLDVFEKSDKSLFQRRARILQSMWRIKQNIDPGIHQGHKLGSLLPMPRAKESFANFITDRTREVVRREIADNMGRKSNEKKLYSEPRIFNNLLSSQPLCFNQFAELSHDLDLASAVVAELTERRFRKVLKIDFEYSPGRRDPRYTGDRSAMDVFLKCKTRTGKLGFIGIEVKYHEDMREPADGNTERHEEHLERYKEIAAEMGCFKPDGTEALMAAPLEQIWRDHLLTGITRLRADHHEDALFVMLYPKDNEAVGDAIKNYRNCLTNDNSFAAWTLEDVTRCIKTKTASDWIEQFF